MLETIKSESRFGILDVDSYRYYFSWGSERSRGCPQGTLQDRGGVEALVRRCAAAAAALRLGEAVWLGGWVEKALKESLCISICKISVGFSGRSKAQIVLSLETTKPDRGFGIVEPDSYKCCLLVGSGGTQGCPQDTAQDRGSLVAFVRRCCAAAGAPRLGDAVWLRGSLKEVLKKGVCIGICKILVRFLGPQN